MKFLSWKIWLAISLIGASVALYALNYLIFRDAGYMFRLFLAQLGFLPISVLLVTIILNQLLTQRAKRAKLAKLNMVIGAFFSEVGTALLGLLAPRDLNLTGYREQINSLSRWSDTRITGFTRKLAVYDFQLSLAAGDLASLKDYLQERRAFLMRLLENPNLLEHDTFSNLLLAVFHFTEELSHRTDLGRLGAQDLEHLSQDAQRVYSLLVCEWLAYMRHLKDRYPYLFSLALRTNPFDPEASPEIK